MSNVTFIFITNRDHPELQWFLDSVPQAQRVIVVDGQFDKRPHAFRSDRVQHVSPKPTVWSGKHRITREDFWSAANSRNTGICLCRTPFISFVDDRSVMLLGWYSHIERMLAGEPYVLCSSYQKRHSMTVENGVIKNAGVVTGDDGRAKYCDDYYSPHKHLQPPYPAPGEWTYGCSLTLPLEWALEVGGFDETCDGLSFEDSIFGLQLKNNGRDIRFEPRMVMVEDRTPMFSGPAARRDDYGKSPDDYSHKILHMLRPLKRAAHGFNIREVREIALAGKSWPAPWGPTHHLWDGKHLAEL